jgi:predicted naringenin-chalcone synthase
VIHIPNYIYLSGDVFFELGWPEDALEGSYDTFSNFGNLGSAAMLFVLAHRLGQDNIKEDKLITMVRLIPVYGLSFYVF